MIEPPFLYIEAVRKNSPVKITNKKTENILISSLRGCKKINLTICRKNHDLILGPTTRSIPLGM